MLVPGGAAQGMPYAALHFERNAAGPLRMPDVLRCMPVAAECLFNRDSGGVVSTCACAGQALLVPALLPGGIDL